MRPGLWLGLLLAATVPAEPVRFVAQGRGYRVEVHARRVCLVDAQGFGDGDRWFRDDAACVELLDAATDARFVSGGSLNAVRVLGVYPGVDLQYAGDGRTLRLKFVTRDPAAAASVHLRSTGFGFRKTSEGVLRIHMPAGRILIDVASPASGAFRLRRGRARFELTAVPASSGRQSAPPDRR